MSELLNNSQQEVNELYQVNPSSQSRHGGGADARPQYFNEELDGMFDAANLPDDDAWAAMTKKVKESQQGKMKAEQENSYVSLHRPLEGSTILKCVHRQLKNRISELEIRQQQ